NIETKETFLSLLKHFVYDVFHFDSKFFDSVHDVLFRPGYMSRQYVDGKRARFLDPIRMYLFTSAVFFLFLFSFRYPAKSGFIHVGLNTETSKKERLQAMQEVQQELKARPIE